MQRRKKSVSWNRDHLFVERRNGCGSVIENSHSKHQRVNTFSNSQSFRELFKHRKISRHFRSPRRPRRTPWHAVVRSSRPSSRPFILVDSKNDRVTERLRSSLLPRNVETLRITSHSPLIRNPSFFKVSCSPFTSENITRPEEAEESEPYLAHVMFQARPKESFGYRTRRRRDFKQRQWGSTRKSRSHGGSVAGSSRGQVLTSWQEARDRGTLRNRLGRRVTAEWSQSAGRIHETVVRFILSRCLVSPARHGIGLSCSFFQRGSPLD